MLKKHINKIFIVLLCFALLPISLFSNSVAKASDVVTVYCGAKYMYYTNDDIANASSNNVQITVKTTGSTDDAILVYEEGKQKDVDSPISSVANSKGNISIIFGKVGNYTVTTTVKDETDAKFTFVKDFKATNDFSECSGPSYTTDLTKLQNFQTSAQNAAFEEGDTTKPLYQGDSYEVPSIKDIVDAGSLGLDMYKRVLYVSTPGSNYYSESSTVSITNTTTKLSFSITNAGVYRYYVLLESDLVNGEAEFSLSVAGLVEAVKQTGTDFIFDGFYRAFRGTEELVATKFNNEYTYVLKDDEETEVLESEITKYELVVPTFNFEIEGGLPPRATYKGKAQENGYVGLTYTISAFDVSGYKVQESYVLYYTETYDKDNDANNNWVKVEDGFDGVSMSFVPDKVGYYKVAIQLEDGYDNDTVIVESLVVPVLDEPIYPNFKTSFGDWISVNTMPFICLCVSGTCLIAIICLIFIKPKKKTGKAEEEDR